LGQEETYVAKRRDAELMFTALFLPEFASKAEAADQTVLPAGSFTKPSQKDEKRQQKNDWLCGS